MNATLHRTLAVAVLLLAVTLLQYHGIAWWTHTVTGSPIVWAWGLLLAPWTGWGYSVLLGLGELWAWSAWATGTGARRWLLWLPLALTATVLLVLGPVAQHAEPLTAELAQADPRALAAMERQAEAAAGITEQATSNSAARTGWAPTMQQGLDTLGDTTGSIVAAVQQQATAAWTQARVGAVLAATLLAALYVPLAITTLARGHAVAEPGRTPVQWLEVPGRRTSGRLQRLRRWWHGWRVTERATPAETDEPTPVTATEPPVPPSSTGSNGSGNAMGSALTDAELVLEIRKAIARKASPRATVRAAAEATGLSTKNVSLLNRYESLQRDGQQLSRQQLENMAAHMGVPTRTYERAWGGGSNR